MKKRTSFLAENVKLQEENVKLSNLIMESQSAVPNELTKEPVLMGSSILKPISDEFTLASTKVYGKSGGRIADIISELEKRGSKEKYQSATFVISGNDCESPKEVGEIVNDFRTLIDTAKSKMNMSHCQACCPGKVGRSSKTKLMRSIPNFQIYVMKNHVNMLTMTVLSNCLMVAEMTHYNIDGKHLNNIGKIKMLNNLGLLFKERTCANVAASKREPRTKDRQQVTTTGRRPSDWTTVTRNSHRRADQTEPCCHFCGIKGHMKSQCRHSNYLRCFDCGNYGHKRRYCPN